MVESKKKKKDTDNNNEQTGEMATPKEHVEFKKDIGRIQIRATTYGGLIFIIISVLMFITLSLFLYFSEQNVSMERTWDVLSAYFPQVLMFVAALLSAMIGIILLRMAGTAQKQVIPERDYELITGMLKTEKSGIDGYIKLSSLIGISGFFTKIGFSGLPLATILLTLIFSFLALFTDPKTGPNFFYLSKLTLGAFIGSYVQKQVPEAAALFKK